MVHSQDVRESSWKYRSSLRPSSLVAGTIFACRTKCSCRGSSNQWRRWNRRRRFSLTPSSMLLLRNRNLSTNILAAYRHNGHCARSGPYLLMMLCSGGFSLSGPAWVTLLATGSLNQSSVMVDRSRLPLKHSKGRLSFATEGLWYSAYALVAS